MTGGRTVMNTGTPEAHLPDVFAESNSFYLLAFAPADRQTNGKYHKIEVKVNRPGASVRTRSGYFAGETRVPDSKPSVVSPETAAALEGVLPRTDLPLSVSAAPLAMPGREESAVAVVLGVRQPVPRDRSDANEPVKVLAAAFDRNGRSVHSEEQTVGIALPLSAAGDFSYEVLSRLTLKPGRYEIRVALDAAPTQRASVYTYVDVPNFRDQQLSSVRHRARRIAVTAGGAVGRVQRSLAGCSNGAARVRAQRPCVGIPPHLPGVEGCASAGRRDGANRGHERPRPDEGCCVVRIRAVRIKPRRGLSTRTSGRAIEQR